jgi:hypothetical protein
MEHKEDKRITGGAAAWKTRVKRYSARGAHWKKFDFGKGQGPKLWQVLQVCGHKPGGA